MDVNRLPITVLLFAVYLISTGHGVAVTVRLRQEAVLKFHNSIGNYDCHFGKIVNRCQWKYAERVINFDQFGLRFKQGNGSNTFDCSLEVYNSTIYNKTFPSSRSLFCEANVTTAPLRVQIGDQVQLTCLVNRPVNCAWKRNGDLMVNGSFEYLRGRFHTNDCTIVILKASLSHSATWECWIREQLDINLHEILAIHSLIVTNETCENDARYLKQQSQPFIIDSSSRVLIAVCTLELLLIILISTAFAVYVYGVNKYKKKPIKRKSTRKNRKSSVATSTAPAIESFVTETAEIYSPLYELMRMKRSATHPPRSNRRNFRRVTFPEMRKDIKTEPIRIPSYLDLI
ncbi:hypothetical protein CHUAL_003582 [Chamberlinius hualienensis]